MAFLKNEFHIDSGDLYANPSFEKIVASVHAFELIQEPGDVVFVPSGYMHQVINLEDTISINHNWFNACNIAVIQDNLIEAKEQVENELKHLESDLDPDEWFDVCQTTLLAHFGMDYDMFARIVLNACNHELNTQSTLNATLQKSNLNVLLQQAEKMLCKLKLNEQRREHLELIIDKIKLETEK